MRSLRLQYWAGCEGQRLLRVPRRGRLPVPLRVLLRVLLPELLRVPRRERLEPLRVPRRGLR